MDSEEEGAVGGNIQPPTANTGPNQVLPVAWWEPDFEPGDHYFDRLPPAYHRDPAIRGWWTLECYDCRRRGHTARGCDQQVSVLKCIYCGRRGHHSVHQCPLREIMTTILQHEKTARSLAAAQEIENWEAFVPAPNHGNEPPAQPPNQIAEIVGNQEEDWDLPEAEVACAPNNPANQVQNQPAYDQHNNMVVALIPEPARSRSTTPTRPSRDVAVRRLQQINHNVRQVIVAINNDQNTMRENPTVTISLAQISQAINDAMNYIENPSANTN